MTTHSGKGIHIMEISGKQVKYIFNKKNTSQLLITVIRTVTMSGLEEIIYFAKG